MRDGVEPELCIFFTTSFNFEFHLPKAISANDAKEPPIMLTSNLSPHGLPFAHFDIEGFGYFFANINLVRIVVAAFTMDVLSLTEETCNVETHNTPPLKL